MSTVPRKYEIYGLHNGDGVIRYVGLSSKGAKHRFYVHRTNTKAGLKRPVHDWMRKYFDDVTYVVLDVCESFDELKVAEIRRIAEFETYLPDGKNGLNLTRGGDGSVGWVPTEENRAKMSEANKARASTNNYWQGRTFTEEHCSKLGVGGSRGSHTRWHVARGISNPQCSLCERSAGEQVR